MKRQYVILPTVLTIALTLSVSGQHMHGDKAKTDMKQHDHSSMMGKPTVDATVEGLHMRVWLMTQEQHKEMMKTEMGQMMMHGKKEGAMGRMEMKGKKDTSMVMGKDMKGMKDTSMVMGKDMKGMKHGGMGMDKATKEAMTAGTHHIMLDITDAASGKDIANASAKVLIESPSKKNSSVDLTAMMSHFGGALTLDEKGEYRFTLDVNVAGVSKTTQFQYAVK